MYVLSEGSSVVRYPYSLYELRKDNPNISFPVDFSDEELESFNVYRVKPVAPSYDQTTQEAKEVNPVFDSESGDWLQSWEIKDLAPEEALRRRLMAADYRKFYNLLISSAVYQRIRAQATQSLALAVAATEFIAAISDAKNGYVNQFALQACINNVVDAATLTSEELADIEQMLTESKMNQLYAIG